MATPASPVVTDSPAHPAVMLSSTSASVPSQTSAHARLTPDPRDHPDLPETTDSPETPEAQDKMDVPVALESPDLPASLVSPVVPAHPAQLETPVPPALLDPPPLVAPESPDVKDLRDPLANLETPAKAETTVPPALPASPVNLDSPVNPVLREPPEMLETTVAREVATTAHRLVWLLAIKRFSEQLSSSSKFSL